MKESERACCTFCRVCSLADHPVTWLNRRHLNAGDSVQLSRGSEVVIEREGVGGDLGGRDGVPAPGDGLLGVHDRGAWPAADQVSCARHKVPHKHVTKPLDINPFQSPDFGPEPKYRTCPTTRTKVTREQDTKVVLRHLLYLKSICLFDFSNCEGLNMCSRLSPLVPWAAIGRSLQK